MGTSERPRPSSPEIHRLDARHSQQELREAGNAGFKGTTYTFTNVDLSKLPPGSVGIYYLVNLPGNGAEGMTATASNQHGSFKAYADAQGCAGWSGKQEAGQVCAQASGQKQGDNNIAGEMDLFEANMYGFSTTSHGCHYEEPNFTGTITGGTTTCNWGGNVLGVHASTPTPGAAPHVNLVPASAPGTSCAGMPGPDSRAISSSLYGPNAACDVNTLLPIDSIEVAISADGARFDDDDQAGRKYAERHTGHDARHAGAG